MPANPLTIGRLAAQAGLKPDTLRYYERVGLLPQPPRTEGGYRAYDASTLRQLSFIRKAQVLGLSLEEIREVLRLASAGTPPCEHVRDALGQKLAEIDARIGELRSLRRSLARALRPARRVPHTKDCVCGIIEHQKLREQVARSSRADGRRKSR